MLINTLLVAHIAVLGYWLGCDLVINSTFRYVVRANTMALPERERLLDHVLDIDQHVRYALILQIGLGTALGALLGYFRGSGMLAGTAGILAVAWLALVEFTHRLRRRPAGRPLASIDRGLRYLAIAILLVVAAASLVGMMTMEAWLAWKLALLAGVVACGLGIRFELVRFFRAWDELEAPGSADARERQLRRRYATATAVLVLLWLFIAGIVALSIAKPA